MNISGLRRRAPAMQMIHDHLSGVFEHGCTTLESLLEGDALMGVGSPSARLRLTSEKTAALDIKVCVLPVALLSPVAAHPSGDSKAESRRQLNVISGRAVEGAIAADSNDRLAIAQDNIDGFGPPPWRVFHGWGDECGDAVDLGVHERR